MPASASRRGAVPCLGRTSPRLLHPTIGRRYRKRTRGAHACDRRDAGHAPTRSPLPPTPRRDCTRTLARRLRACLRVPAGRHDSLPLRFARARRAACGSGYRGSHRTRGCLPIRRMQTLVSYRFFPLDAARRRRLLEMTRGRSEPSGVLLVESSSWIRFGLISRPSGPF